MTFLASMGNRNFPKIVSGFISVLSNFVNSRLLSDRDDPTSHTNTLH
jgi:hypothetical protein